MILHVAFGTTTDEYPQVRERNIDIPEAEFTNGLHSIRLTGYGDDTNAFIEVLGKDKEAIKLVWLKLCSMYNDNKEIFWK